MQKLEEYKNQIIKIKSLPRYSPEFEAWKKTVDRFLQKEFGEQYGQQFNQISYSLGFAMSGMADSEYQKPFDDGLKEAELFLQGIIDEHANYLQPEEQPMSTPISSIDLLCSKFHLVARQLRQRHKSRSTLTISDEYDVQDLLHSLLRIFFDDIRPEEWTPSYAGAASRMDFVLKNEKIVIEVKKTRDSLGVKEIGEQLIVDIAKYNQHPDCKILYCFVYDSDELILNPKSLETDLSKNMNGLKVIVRVIQK